MQLATLCFRSLVHHRRAGIAVALGAAVGTAVLTGALLVGDSMRGSLRDVALSRLGAVDYALRSGRFFRQTLADDIVADEDFQTRFGVAVPLIMLRGAATHPTSHATVHRVNVLGVDDRFSALDTSGVPHDAPAAGSRQVILNRPLAEQLGAKTGDDILLRLTRPTNVSSETLLGRRDTTAMSVRLSVAGVIPTTGLGQFSLEPKQPLPLNAYLPLDVLQRILGQPNRINTILVAGRNLPNDASNESEALQGILHRNVSLTDVGLSLRVDEAHGYVALESSSFLIEPPVEAAAMDAAADLGLPLSRVLTYLANTIATDDGRRTIPYSTVAAVDDSPGAALESGDIVLNEWAADRLGVSLGDAITLSYYLTESFGVLSTSDASFVLRGIVPLDGAAADPGFTPSYPGITDSRDMADWDPPFPVDLRRVTDADERYWDQHRTTPKAFISLVDGWRLWGQDADRFGRLTSIRLYRAQETPTQTPQDIAEVFERQLITRLDPASLGLQFDAVRARAYQAGAGTTDFASLFIGFSFFLILSAVLLMILLFRLGVERRAGEMGLLLSIGWTPARVVRMLLTEGAILSALGCFIGLVGAVGYAALMVHGLRSWWAAAANAPFLELHVSGGSLAIGYAASFLVSLLAVLWSLRGVLSQSARFLLAGALQLTPRSDLAVNSRSAKGIAVASTGIGAVLLVCTTVSDIVPPSAAFFGVGMSLLVAGLALTAHQLGRRRGHTAARKGQWPLTRIGLGNARRQILRSMTTIGLVASATFVITALEPFRLESVVDPADRQSGTGGFPLYAEADVPLPFDLNSPDGRESLGISPAAAGVLAATHSVGFRLRPGDETGCTNAYRPNDPRILGATSAMLARGGFTFSASLARTPAEESNPWLLLEATLWDGLSSPSDDGAIPAIADENAVKWQLQLGLGQDLTVTDERGRSQTLRFVALLKGSALQDEIIIHESSFERLFPSRTGYGFFLIDTASTEAASVQGVLETELTRYGLDVAVTTDRLAAYFAVQNVFLSTFQMLGGLGLVLGALGLGVVLMRNVWDRRSELALMQAVGFSRSAIAWCIFAENAALVIVGSTIGLIAATAAVMPAVIERAGSIPWASLIVTVGCAPAAAMVAAGLALAAALRGPLLPALRRE